MGKKESIKKSLKRFKGDANKHYPIQKLIFFGSRAVGKPNKDSDIDILVIKDTKDHPIRRIQSVSRLIDRKIAFDFIVMTPRELDERLTLGDFFFHDLF